MYCNVTSSQTLKLRECRLLAEYFYNVQRVYRPQFLKIQKLGENKIDLAVGATGLVCMFMG